MRELPQWLDHLQWGTRQGRGTHGVAAWLEGQQCARSPGSASPPCPGRLQGAGGWGFGHHQTSSCASPGAAAPVRAMCPLHQPSVPLTRATSEGCLHLLPHLLCPQGGWLRARTRVAHTPGTRPWPCFACILPGSPASLAAPVGRAASAAGWRLAPRQRHPCWAVDTHPSPGPCRRGAMLPWLYGPASAPWPQAAPSPSSVFFLKNNISAKYFNQISSSVSAVLLNQCSPTHLGG